MNKKSGMGRNCALQENEPRLFHKCSKQTWMVNPTTTGSFTDGFRGQAQVPHILFPFLLSKIWISLARQNFLHGLKIGVATKGWTFVRPETIPKWEVIILSLIHLESHTAKIFTEKKTEVAASLP